MNTIENNLKKVQSFNNLNSDPTGQLYKSFNLSITKYVTNVDGTLIDKSTIPAFAQKSYPVFLFGQYDHQGSYKIGHDLLPPPEGMFFISCQTVGNYFDLIQFSGANNIKQQLQIGDQIFIYSDSVQFPSFFIWVVISRGIRAYSSLLKNPINSGMDIFLIKYVVDLTTQYINSINIVDFDEIGNYERNTVDPITFKTADTFQDNFIDMKIDYKIHNFSGLYFFQNFLSDEISMNFRYHKLK